MNADRSSESICGCLVVFHAIQSAARLVAGTAFHLGNNNSAATNAAMARHVKMRCQPQLSWSKPGVTPPTIAPMEPKPLTKPVAVDAPFFAPKSTTATPAIIASGAYARNPSRNKLNANTQRVEGK